jgi:Tol biopolymer transport system component
MAGPLAETDHVLGHELVHAFQFDITGNVGPVSSNNIPGALSLPLWFVEGMAEYLSLGPVDAHTAMWMRDAISQDKPLPRIDQLNNPEYFPYRWGQSLWAYLAGRWGDGIVSDALRAANRGGEAERILEVLTGVPIKDLSDQWHKALREAYGPVIDSRERPERVARAIITEKNGGEMNFGPSASPDGTKLTFLSEKDLFSIDMYLADGRTGQVKDKIISTATDPHYESLQFISSAGGWDPAGQRFAVGAVRKGRATLAIRAVGGGKAQEIRFKEVDEIFDPTFSPDGRMVAFSGLKGGLLDLWVCDLQTKSLRRLTSDAFADLQPAWSPDGQSIAFVTDRFTTRLENLMPGEYRLATIDPQGGTVRELPSFEDAKNIDPQWSADGASLFFVSDRNGSSNVYRLHVASGETFQLTNVSTGVSGITALSPSLSVARDRAFFSMYEDGKYRIYVVEGAERMAGTAVRMPAERLRASTLPPQDRPRSQVATFLSQPNTGLPEAKTFEVSDYKPKLTLDYIGQPTLTLGADPRGAFVGGGVSFLFSDILGNHTLGAVLQINGEFKDFGGIIAPIAGPGERASSRSRTSRGRTRRGPPPWTAAGSTSSSRSSTGRPAGPSTRTSRTPSAARAGSSSAPRAGTSASTTRSARTSSPWPATSSATSARTCPRPRA